MLVVAFGDSVTAGFTTHEMIAHEDVYHARLKQQLQQLHPLCLFSAINAGVPGDTAANALQRLDRDVIRHQPDLVLVAFELNDAVQGGLPGIGQYRDALTKIIQRIRAGTTADIILLTPTLMAGRDNPGVHTEHRQHVEAITRTQNDGTLAIYAEATREVSRANRVLLADVQTAWREVVDRGVDVLTLLANGLNHPTPVAHQIAADVLMQCIAE
jgi:acyl-CoA thioesterase I